MENLRKIEQFLLNNDIENAYNVIIENEENYKNIDTFWYLKGVLCQMIGEYDLAINHYISCLNINFDYKDAYYNLISTYIQLGNKLKASLFAGIVLRHNDDLEFENEITSFFKDSNYEKIYNSLIQQIKLSEQFNHNNVDLIKYISYDISKSNNSYNSLISNFKSDNDLVYIKDNYVITDKEIIDLESFLDLNLIKTVVLSHNVNYINLIRKLADRGIKSCFVAVPIKGNLVEVIEIDESIMNSLKNKEYKNTITIHRFNSADSNTFALIKYIPQKYKNIFKFNIVEGRDFFKVENIIKVPLLSNITISGFGAFSSYPKFTYNIDIGHAGIIMKNCGIMDKKYKSFSFTPNEYKNIDKVYISSNLAMFIQSAFSSIPEDKYEITGNPRTDTLILSDGKTNLEKLINRKLNDEKIIFNMPTYHIHENTGILSGEIFEGGIKIKEFDYIGFNEFLKDNNILCVSKVHHAEEKLVTNKMKKYNLTNMIFVSNNDLKEKELDLYEILNSADLLITDYSSIYADFLFMDKPVVFVNEDIETYRKQRGLTLEPYDFWTAGPKVQNQDDLQIEIKKSITDKEYYRQKRKELKTVFFKNIDSNSTERVWDSIYKIYCSINKKEGI